MTQGKREEAEKAFTKASLERSAISGTDDCMRKAISYCAIRARVSELPTFSYWWGSGMCWTGFIALLLEMFGRLTAQDALETPRERLDARLIRLRVGREWDGALSTLRGVDRCRSGGGRGGSLAAAHSTFEVDSVDAGENRPRVCEAFRKILRIKEGSP